MNDNLFIPDVKLFADILFRRTKKNRCINKIWNNRDLFFWIEHSDCFVFQVARNSRHTIRFVDGQPDNVLHPPVSANNGNISAMKRGCQFETLRLRTLVFQYLQGKHGAQSMRNRIMGLYHIKLFIISDLCNFRSKRKGIKRSVKQRIMHHFNLVVENVAGISTQPERSLLAEKMDGMALHGKRLSQLSGNCSASTISVMTGYSDFHYSHCSETRLKSHFRIRYHKN